MSKQSDLRRRARKKARQAAPVEPPAPVEKPKPRGLPLTLQKLREQQNQQD
jgi:hypothetical protein